MTVREALSSVLSLQLFPRTRLAITVQVLRDDGALLAACINAAMLACLDAGFPCTGVITAVGIAAAAETKSMNEESKDNEDENMSDEASSKKRNKKSKVMEKEVPFKLLLDPTASEEQSAPATATFAFTNVPKIVDLPVVENSTKTMSENELVVDEIALPKQELVTCITYGVWGISDFYTSTKKAAQVSESTYSLFRQTFNA